jgi:hypothetical protein
MSRTIPSVQTARKKKTRRRSAVTEIIIVTEICAACGQRGEVGREVGPLASRDWVHHTCWPAFYHDGLRAVLPGDLF